MESRFSGAPIPATPKAAAVAASYKGIRAPLTVDESDFEYSVSSKSRRNSTTSSYYSGSELESEGFDSGEDELEAVSERANVVEKDGEILEETQEFVVSEPYVKSPDEKFVQESGSVSGNAVLRPVVRIPDKQIYSNFDESDDSGSLLSESGDEIGKDESYVVKYSGSRFPVGVKDGEVSENGLLPLVDSRVPLVVQKLHIPVAKISADSDEDSQGSEVSDVSDEEGFSGIARIPSVEVLHRINSVPKVRILESDGEDSELLGEFVEDLVISNVVLGPSDEKEHLDVDEDAMDNSVVVNEEADSATESGQGGDVMHLDEGIQEIDGINEQKKCVESVDNEDLDSTSESGQNGDAMHLDVEIQEIDVIDEQKCVESVDNEEIDPTSEQGQNGNAMHLVEEIQEIDVADEQKKCVELVESEELDSQSEQGQNGDSIHLNEEIQEIDVVDEQQKCVESVDNEEIDSTSESAQNRDSTHLVEEIQEMDVIVEQKKCVELVDYRESTDISEDIIFPEKYYDHSNRSERVESEHEISSIQQCVDIKEVPAEGCREFPKLSISLTESVFSCMSDSLSKDGESVFEGSGLDQETRKDYENSDQLSERISDNFVLPSTNGELEEAISEKERKKREKIQQIRVKYLRLIQKLGCSPEDSVASEVLYQLTLAEKRSTSQAFHLDPTKKDDLVFSLSILVIGKTGVGKSATINSIFGEKRAVIDAFKPSTTHVREIIGTIDGVKFKVFDTPGLRPCLVDRSINRKILSSIKKLIQKSPPDIILYVDRLDTQTGLNDLPLLKSLTSYLGSSIWRKSIIAFTHGNSIPPDGPHGYPLSYEAFVSQQSRTFQKLIGHSVIPVCVVENHGIGETLLCNGERWRSNLLLLCYSMKTLSELSTMIKIHNPLNHRIAIMSSLLQPNVHPKLSNDQSCDNVVSDDDMALLPSFDGDSPCLRYRLLEPFFRLLTMPGFDSPWDHDELSIITFVEENVVKGRLAVGKWVGNAGSVRFSVGRNSRFSVCVALDSNLSGQISIKTRCLDQLQIAAQAFVPITRGVFKKIFGQSSED